MEYIDRTVEKRLAGALARGRSVLLLGARQTGKTTLAQRLNPDLHRTQVLAALCQELDRGCTFFPATHLRLRYAVAKG